MSKRDFAIIGNGLSGTSLLQSLLNAHPGIICEFEKHVGPQDFNQWKIDSLATDKTWGNKQPIERLLSMGWNKEYIISIVDSFYVINTVRRYSGYADCFKRRYIHRDIAWMNKDVQTKLLWDLNHKIYWAMCERQPGKVIRVVFEDLLTNPKGEALRILEFLNIDYTDLQIDQMVQCAPNNIKYYPKSGTIDQQKATMMYK